MKMGSFFSSDTSSTAWPSSSILTGLLATVILLLLALPTDCFVMIKQKPSIGTRSDTVIAAPHPHWWYPKDSVSADCLTSIDKQQSLEEQSAALAATLVHQRLQQLAGGGGSMTANKAATDTTPPNDHADIHPLAKERALEMANELSSPCFVRNQFN
jgi:hypothetical protein